MTILIAGGAGYIGSHINLELSRNGIDTIVFDNLSRGHRGHVLSDEFVLGDLANPNDIDMVFKSHNIKAVMHFAAFSCVGESVSNPALYYQNNVTNTLNLLTSMQKYGINKLVFSSTSAVYGVPNSGSNHRNSNLKTD